MTTPRIVVAHTRCTGCHACVLNCALVHVGAVRPGASAIRIASSEDEGRHIPLLCIACEDRPCLEACPEGAIRLDGRLDVPVIDNETCIGCRACLSACPYQGIFFDRNAGKAVKCDLCDGDPQCVKVCAGEYGMPGALTLQMVEDLEWDEDARTAVAHRMQAHREIRKGGAAT
jgi:carbon-monoxide dehydrogenase iron sulfur subunit